MIFFLKEKTTKRILESPKKMARLKSPQTSEKEDKNSNDEWVLPITCKTEVIPKDGEIRESNNEGNKFISKPAENSILSTCPIKEKTETESEEKRQDVCDKIKYDTTKVGFAVSSETETNKEGTIDLRLVLFSTECQFNYSITVAFLS